ncbi:hypothetical protein RIF29_15266 [Crotalaria pallida]|uniref:Uncharacterized protein n=1 Tax=Crotalaria pallida TaxID=3830 RepID=A0AAN9FD74_CROPI
MGPSSASVSEFPLGYELGVRDPINEKIWLGPGAKLDFFPPGLIGDDIAEIIKARYSGAWPTWSHVPKATRKEWLELFEEKINLKRPTCMDVLGRTKKKKDGRWVGKAEEVAVTNPYH